MLIYRNDTGKEVKLKLPPKEGEEMPTEITVEAGATYEIDDETARSFLNYDLQATKVETEAKDEGKKAEDATAGETAVNETEVKDPEEAVEKTEEEDVAVKEAETKLAEREAKLAEERREFNREKAETRFKKLCEEGKAIPAQKEDYMALSLHEGTAAVREGESKSVSELLNHLMESAPGHSLFEEQGVDGKDETETELTDEEKEVAETFGNSEEDIKQTKQENK